MSSVAARPQLANEQPGSRAAFLISRVFLALVVVVVVFFGVTCIRIVREASVDETRPADAIVVFGAAEYAGHPSPVLRLRLDHALELFQHGIAPVIITTGGSGNDPRFSEGGVGRAYLTRRGVPQGAVIAETESTNTDRSAERVAAIMRSNGMKSCIAVSDRYHMFRVKHMMERQGIVVYGAPRPEVRAASFFRRAFLVGREAISYTLWTLHIT
jgi:uncharacterized SAM-binding protein YcdF (DUF218 family)